jgi:hypothetical protein
MGLAALPRSLSRRLISLAARLGAVLAIVLVAAELMAAYLLFRYSAAEQTALHPTGLASVYLVEKTLKIPLFRQVSRVEPAPLYVADERLGYVATPGRHRITISVGKKSLSFVMTVPRAGERSTGYIDTPRARSIYVFGDSFVLGWVNNDEQTMPWLLQQRFPDYRVVNLAQNGYGLTQAVLNYQRLRDRLQTGDVLILPYADFYLQRDYGAPGWMRSLSRGIEQRLGGNDAMAGARYPVTRPGADGLPTIRYLAISCSAPGNGCEGAEPDRATMAESTKSILRFFAAEKHPVMLAFLQGAADDPVVAYARSLGMPVADIRLDRATGEWDDFGIFDGHPGPIAQFHYFEKLSRALLECHLLGPTQS